MAKASDFIRQLASLPGVTGYLLTHNNGRILSHNLSDPTYYVPWAQQMINRSTYLTDSLNNEQLRGISLKQDGENLVHLFPVRQYHLVVIQSEEIVNDHLFQQVAALIQDTVEQG